MRAGSTPSSSESATRSIKTLVLPEPAFAESQVEALGFAASIWRRLASSKSLIMCLSFRLSPIRQNAKDGHNHWNGRSKTWRVVPYSLGLGHYSG